MLSFDMFSIIDAVHLFTPCFNLKYNMTKACTKLQSFSNINLHELPCRSTVGGCGLAGVGGGQGSEPVPGLEVLYVGFHVRPRRMH